MTKKRKQNVRDEKIENKQQLQEPILFSNEQKLQEPVLSPLNSFPKVSSIHNDICLY